VLPDDAEAGGGLMVAVIQLAIALGATGGGVLYDASGFRSTFALGAVALTVSALFATKAWRDGGGHPRAHEIAERGPAEEPTRARAA
jgi:predicted MFS family arabinose efflux permease